MELKYEPAVPLSKHTTFKIGGAAEEFVSVTTELELEQAITYAKSNKQLWFVLGGGSNVLASDTGFPGLVIKNEISGITVVSETEETVVLTVGAGEALDDVVQQCVLKGYWGLENLSHIPGTVGAAPIQNVGAYGVEIESVVTAVRVLNTTTLEFRNFTVEECAFAYRDSFFKTDAGRKYVVSAVTFTLSKIPKPILDYKDLLPLQEKNQVTLAEVRDAVIAIRSKKFPDWNQVGTAGSFFKNPVIATKHYQKLVTEYPDLPGFAVTADTIKIPLGWVLDKVCDIRGVRSGAVGSYAGQALVFINYGSATAAEVTQFAEKISKTVFDKTKISIEWEVTRL